MWGDADLMGLMKERLFSVTFTETIYVRKVLLLGAGPGSLKNRLVY